jgi:hypothetical protein
MSGYPAGSGEGNGLDSLLAQLRQQQNKPVTLEPSFSYYNNGSNYFGQPIQSQQPHYHQPLVSSPIPTPPTIGQQPHHSSAIMSPVETPTPRIPIASGGASNADRTSSLLNLLKFSQPSTSSAVNPAPIGTPLPASREASSNYPAPDTLGQIGAPAQGRGGSDLLAALMGSVQSKAGQQASPQFATAAQPAQPSFSPVNTSPPANTQAYLLQLLNQPKPAQSDSTAQLKSTKVFTPPSKPSSQDGVGEITQALEGAAMDRNMMGEAATESVLSFVKENVRESPPKNTQGLFTYVNPFEQLAASSPRNRTPKNSTPGPSSSPAIQILKHPRRESTDTKRKPDERDAASSPAHTKRKLERASQASSSPPTPLPDGRTQVEALMGIGAPGHKETVHDSLNKVGDHVDKEVQEAIARAKNDESQASIEQDLQNMLEAKTEEDFEASAQVASTSIKKELERGDNSGALDNLPAPVAEAVKDIIDDAAQGHIADSWESADAEDSPIKDEEDSVVKVYNFPMRPWTSITIKESEETRPIFRDEAIMDIARLKKDFDQIDRTLVTASNNFIVYGMSKNGGVRIIRQDDGKDARLFTETHDRIFSVVTSSSSADLKESIIGTGISGTVYWALIKDGEGDHIEESNPEMYGFALPPIQAQDSESPGGILKTRARKSSAHPDFFAVGRGKFIHVVWPSVILKQSYLKNGKDRIVDVEKYLSKHSLKVNTGKAGKDFTFSEDDTTIVSLDKAGRVKFWDVRSLTKTDMVGNPSHAHNVEIKEPLITFTTTPASEKSWPTSVLFVDKLRPYQRGGALRYLIVGMKQNHTLQLWDLALGKPVQEIHLPHSKESDAVCSVLYHAATGMIIVGHPTRNSIYFLHLSAPKYNLPKNVTQAEYIEKLVASDPSVPKPDSTAVISGMREYSFANKGVLRSLDILQTPNSASAGGDPPTLFELYAMHSKGVTCLNIKQADLGWTSDNKVIEAVVADKVGVISIDTLKEIPVAPAPEVIEPAGQPSVPTRIVPRPAGKESMAKEAPRKATLGEPSTSVPKIDDKAEKKEVSPSNGGLASASGPEKSEKKKRRKATSENSAAGPSNAPQSSQSAKTVILDPSSNTRNGSLGKANTSTVPETSSGPAVLSQDVSDAALKNIETRVAAEVKKIFGSSLDSLYQNIKDDRRTQAAVAEAKSDAMLRLVSSTLSDNIEVTLGRIVSNSIQKSVLPALTDIVDDQFGSKLNSHLIQNMPMELQKALPDAIGKALQQPQLLKLMSESLAKSVAFRVEEQFAVILQNVVTPAFTGLAIQTSQRVAADVQRQATAQIDNIERQRQADTIKIDQLTQLVTSLSETVSSMAAAQSDFQGQFLRMQQQAVIDRRQASVRQGESHAPRNSISRPSTALAPEKTPEELEYEDMFNSISKAMAQGEYENAVIQWLQTQREQEFFKKYFCQYNPDFIRDLSPLLLLSLGATVSMDFEDELIHQRIAWMETIIAAFLGHYNANTLVRTYHYLKG